MVRARSIKGFDSKRVGGILIAVILAIVLVVGVLIGVFGVIRGEDKKNQSLISGTTLPEAIFSQLSKRTYPMSQPARIPTKFTRVDIQILDSQTTATGCEEVLQSYRGADDPDVDYIDIYSYSADCHYPIPRDAESFSVGNYAGWISEPVDMSTLIELAVRGGLIRIESDMFSTELSDVLSSFVPLSEHVPPDTAKVTISK